MCLDMCAKFQVHIYSRSIFFRGGYPPLPVEGKKIVSSQTVKSWLGKVEKLPIFPGHPPMVIWPGDIGVWLVEINISQSFWLGDFSQTNVTEWNDIWWQIRWPIRVESLIGHWPISVARWIWMSSLTLEYRITGCKSGHLKNSWGAL